MDGQKVFKMEGFSLPPHVRPGDAPKSASPGLGGGAGPFFCVVLCCQNVKFCEFLLGMTSFQCIGGGSVPPQCITRRWAGRHAERRVAWPWQRCRSFFFVPYCVDKTLKSVNFCLQRLVFNALGAAVYRPQSLAGSWARRQTERRVAWPWQRRQCKFLVSHRVGKMLKSMNVFLKMRGFHCIGDGSVPPPPNCRATHQKAHCLALAEAPILLSVSYSVNKMLKFVNVLLGMPNFQCIGGGSVPPPITYRTLGQAAHRMAHRLALAEAPM